MTDSGCCHRAAAAPPYRTETFDDAVVQTLYITNPGKVILPCGRLHCTQFSSVNVETCSAMVSVQARKAGKVARQLQRQFQTVAWHG